jgi:GT2 family glycosyltransferase
MKQSQMISVIIPVLEINYYVIFENLPALDKQTYKNYEVIVLPNEHTPYDIALLKQYKWLRIIPTGTVTRPAEKRDIGAREANGDILAFIDDDAYPSLEWLQKAVKSFQKQKSVAVAGPGILPQSVNHWEKIFDQVLNTFIGAGGYSYRFTPKKPRYVDDFPSMNFLIKKDIFHKLGGFNSKYWPGEDSKLCEDLVYKIEEQIYYDPQVIIYHHRRNSLHGYLKQHGSYGFHRGAFYAHGDKNSKRLSYLIPTFFVLYLIFLVLLWLSYAVTRHRGIFNLLIFLNIPFSLYLLFEVYLFLKSAAKTRSLRIAGGAIIVLFLTHFYYGLMFIKGYTTARSRQNIYQ